MVSTISPSPMGLSQLLNRPSRDNATPSLSSVPVSLKRAAEDDGLQCESAGHAKKKLKVEYTPQEVEMERMEQELYATIQKVLGNLQTLVNSQSSASLPTEEAAKAQADSNNSASVLIARAAQRQEFDVENVATILMGLQSGPPYVANLEYPVDDPMDIDSTPSHIADLKNSVPNIISIEQAARILMQMKNSGSATALVKRPRIILKYNTKTAPKGENQLTSGAASAVIEPRRSTRVKKSTVKMEDVATPGPTSVEAPKRSPSTQATKQTAKAKISATTIKLEPKPTGKAKAPAKPRAQSEPKPAGEAKTAARPRRTRSDPEAIRNATASAKPTPNLESKPAGKAKAPAKSKANSELKPTRKAKASAKPSAASKSKSTGKKNASQKAKSNQGAATPSVAPSSSIKTSLSVLLHVIPSDNNF